MTDALVPDHKIIRLTADWPGIHHEKMPKVGQLVRIDDRDLNRVWSSLANGGWQQPIAKLEFERHPPLTWRDFPALADFYFNGHAELPNLKAAENADSFLDTIACGGGLAAWPKVAHVKLRGDHHSRWARIFMPFTQGGQHDGRGYLIAYLGGGRSGPRLFTFAFCDHAVVTGAGARPTHGWHPASCSRCGLDLSVDSSD
jgi:hypothetical protein